MKVRLLYLFLSLALLLAGCEKKTPTATQTAPVRRKDYSMPTIMEMQKWLNENGYPCGAADGKVGKQTIAAWERYTCDKYAVIYFRESEKTK